MVVEQRVAFLNIDLELFGTFDREVLLTALRKTVILLHQGDGPADRPALVFEVNREGLDVRKTLQRFLDLIRRLPRPARRAWWDAADRRRFDIGIQGGTRPFMSVWTIPPELLAAVAACGAELAITVYGAEWRDATATKRAKKPSKSRGRK